MVPRVSFLKISSRRRVPPFFTTIHPYQIIHHEGYEASYKNDGDGTNGGTLSAGTHWGCKINSAAIMVETCDAAGGQVNVKFQDLHSMEHSVEIFVNPRHTLKKQFCDSSKEWGDSSSSSHSPRTQSLLGVLS